MDQSDSLLEYLTKRSQLLEAEDFGDCELGKDVQRDCCKNNPLLMCRLFASLSLTIFLISFSISMFLFMRRHLIGKESFNFLLHLLINLAFLCT